MTQVNSGGRQFVEVVSSPEKLSLRLPTRYISGYDWQFEAHRSSNASNIDSLHVGDENSEIELLFRIQRHKDLCKFICI